MGPVCLIPDAKAALRAEKCKRIFREKAQIA